MDLELLEYKRNLYFKRDGLTDTVVSLDKEIENLKSVSKLKPFPKKVTIHTNLEIDDYDYQMDIDTQLSTIYETIN